MYLRKFLSVKWSKALVFINSKKCAALSNKRSYHEAATTFGYTKIRGVEHLRDPRLNKGLAFTLEERQTLGIHGLLPACIKTQEEQMLQCKVAIERYEDPLNKYLYLGDLQDCNERLFFRFLTENIISLMPIVYTPTVGLACQKFGLIYRKPRGLFVTIHDRGHIYELLKNWPVPDVRAICVTDGERILGLGDLGAYGMGITIGKLSLCTALAGVPPHMLLPIVIDVGTNNQTLLKDPLYVGLRQERAAQKDYDELLDEFMKAVVRCYGQNTLVQFEDFGIKNAFRLLEKYRHKYCTFNDDIQGTGSVVLAGLFAAERITGKSLQEQTIMLAGAGGAGLGIARLLHTYLTTKHETKTPSNIWMSDINGLLVNSRTDITNEQKLFAKDYEPLKTLEEIVEKVKPTILIGVSGTSGLFTEQILRTMVKNAEQPVVFSLSNPTSKAECTAEQAYKFTDGRVIFSCGSPFPPVTVNGRTYRCGQGNNAYIFPGVALGVIATGTHHVPEEMFLIAAKELANNVSEADLKAGLLYPAVDKIRNISIKIAAAVAQYAFDHDLATEYPEPQCKEEWLKSLRYDFYYDSLMSRKWAWPPLPHIKGAKMDPKEYKL